MPSVPEQGLPDCSQLPWWIFRNWAVMSAGHIDVWREAPRRTAIVCTEEMLEKFPCHVGLAKGSSGAVLQQRWPGAANTTHPLLWVGFV